LPQAKLLALVKDAKTGVKAERVREALATALLAASASAAAASADSDSLSEPAVAVAVTPRTPRRGAGEERRLTYVEFTDTLLALAGATAGSSQSPLQQFERLLDCLLSDAQSITMPLHLESLFLNAHGEMERALHGDLDEVFAKFADDAPLPLLGMPPRQPPRVCMTLLGWTACLVSLHVVAGGKSKAGAKGGGERCPLSAEEGTEAFVLAVLHGDGAEAAVLRGDGGGGVAGVYSGAFYPFSGVC
jgi:hypothetical protein